MSDAPEADRPTDAGMARTDHASLHDAVEAAGEDALLQASRILQQLRTRILDLDRREQTLTSQMSVLDQERRELRERERQFELSLQDRKSAMREEDDALQQRRCELEALAREIGRKQTVLTQTEAEFAARHEEVVQAAARQQSDREALAALEIDMQQREQALLAEQERWHLNRASQHTELEHELNQLREKALAQLDILKTEHEQIEVDLAKRTNFHEAHLGRLREEIEQEHRKGRIEQQQLSARQAETAELNRLRFRQLARFRETLDSREASLETAQRDLEWERRSANAELQRSREKLQAERQSMLTDIESRLAALDARQESLTVSARKLEERRAGLDQLRRDLEAMHEQTLELRVVVAETWGRLVRETDDAEVRVEVEIARSDLDAELAERRQRLIARQQDLESQQRQVGDRQTAFRQERELAARQIAAEAESLALREQHLGEQRRRLAEREEQWREVLDRCEIERQRAERVIRGLLEQLEGAAIADAAPARRSKAA